MNNPNASDGFDFFSYLQPEQELERLFLQDETFLLGLNWGKPRYGHPEGAIYKHIREVLDNIDHWGPDFPFRRALRIIAFVHDTFKYQEDKSYPRDWSKHHSIYARKFLEKYTSDEALLTVTELHDEAYHCWCLQFLYQQPEVSARRLQNMLKRLGEHLQLYYLFFKCDTQTGDKNQAPLKWFEATVANIEIKPLK
jgi:hypothetical protein